MKPNGGLGGFGGFPSRIASKRRPLGVMTAYGSTSPMRNSSPAPSSDFATGRSLFVERRGLALGGEALEKLALRFG